MNSFSKFVVVSCLIASAALLAPSTARACGAFFSTSTVESELVDMSDQRVILIVTDSGRVEQLVQVAYEGNPSSFAWVYPFPSQPDIAEGSDGIFDDVEEQTRPRFNITTESEGGGGGGGCACGDATEGAANGPNDRYVEPPVTLWDQGEVGIFEYVTITATSIDDMTGWLSDNGYQTPSEANAVLQHYVDQGWFFVAMKISPQSNNSRSKTSVLRFTYLTPRLIYPLHMSSISPSGSVGVSLYVFASHRMAAAGTYRTAEIPRGELRATDPESTNYESLFDSATAAGRTFVAEYVQPEGLSVLRAYDLLPPEMEGQQIYLTRLRTTMSPNELDRDVDVVQASDDTTISNLFSLRYTEDGSSGSSGPLFMFVVLAATWLVFGRRVGARARSASRAG